MGRPFRSGAEILCVLALVAGCAPRPVPAPAPAPLPVAELRAYIKDAWGKLSRTAADAADPKLGSSVSVVYAPARDLKEARALVPGARPLPAGIPRPPGLLYLPKPYVVPGGRFNEMYGWDSYFILRGLLQDGELERARDLVDDFLYEVDRYGKVLNANRTYYLTRSQPPFLGRMVLELHERDRLSGRDRLRAALPALEKTWAYWNAAPHLAGRTGLSRYHDSGTGPAPEVVAGERDARGRTHYERVAEKLGPLSESFYENDRAMRESGFDPSDRFGPFGSRAAEVAPVCLNSLLYQLERDIAAVHRLLGDSDGERRWSIRADERRARVEALLWDEKDGLYYDYDFAAGERRPYPFATTFLPLWTGLASPARAARVRDSALARLEKAGGLATSEKRTGEQWDAPFGWAPLQLFAVEGLRRYGFVEDADRLSSKFLSLVLREFAARRGVFEKYDVEAQGSATAGLAFGYASNELGFGWTNGVFEALYAELPDGARARLGR